MNHGPGWALVLERSGLAVWMRQALWAYPAAEVGHLLGVVLLAGCAAALDLRLLGLSQHLSVRQLAGHLLPWAWRGFGLVVVTGAAMFAAHASDWWHNPAFPVKMGLVAAGGVNVWAFHRGVYRWAAFWDQGPPPRAARVAGAVSLAVWMAVVACGRLLAYL
ncbi:MAG: hypothetical protein QN133_07490 [Armatimonadota bacterium]|nr:hypothetical protein [Armatimonadota bacterium]MDR7564220.1 hypothetical protein [Armatimonadota bacterium]